MGRDTQGRFNILKQLNQKEKQPTQPKNQYLLWNI